MIGNNLARRLERLEAETIAANEEPVVIVVQYVSTDGEVWIVSPFERTACGDGHVLTYPIGHPAFRNGTARSERGLYGHESCVRSSAKIEQEIDAEIRQQQKPKKATCTGPWPNSSPTERLRADP